MTGPELSPELSIVIPCYNEEDNVRAICAAVTAEAERHAASHEIILIDNRSTDRTRVLIRELCASDRRIRAIFNTRNFGQMRSPTHGIYQASGAAVIGMCADFQDPPELIGPFMQRWREGAPVVLAQRRSEKTALPLALVRDGGYAFLHRFGDYPVLPDVTGFGLYDRMVVDSLARWNEPEPFFRGMLVESGYHIALIPFDRPQRAAGTSKNNLNALFDFALSGLAASGKRLLRLPVLMAVYAGLITLLLLVAAVAAVFLDGPVWALLGLALGGGMFAVILLVLGLMGEQLRILTERSRGLPLVIEQERINFPDVARP